MKMIKEDCLGLIIVICVFTFILSVVGINIYFINENENKQIEIKKECIKKVGKEVIEEFIFKCFEMGDKKDSYELGNCRYQALIFHCRYY